MNKTKVTVLLSVYNAESYLREAVESVLGQTSGDFEFLIFDDKSTDDSLKILRSCNDPRIRLVLNRQNRGQTPCLVDGMNLAKGEYVARMDADDICLPNRLQMQMDFLEKNPDISLVGSAVTFFDGAGWEAVGYQPTDHDAIKCTLLYGFTMIHPSVMMRKADFFRHGLNYDPQFQCSQDHDLWTRAVRVLRFANVLEPLLKMREHPTKMGHTRRLRMKQESDAIRERQLRELGVAFTPAEISSFNKAASGIPSDGVADLQQFESLLVKIIAANRTKSTFDQSTLEKLGANHFRAWCRDALLHKNSWGRYYWQSKLRAFDSATVREKFGLALRSLVSR